MAIFFWHLKGICKHAFCVAGAVQETFSSELFGGQGCDFLSGVAFWSIRSSGLLKWFSVTGTAFRMTHFRGRRHSSDRWIGKIANLLARGRQLFSQLFILERSLAELRRFWCKIPKLTKSGRIVSFWILSSSKNEEVSQNCFGKLLPVAARKKNCSGTMRETRRRDLLEWWGSYTDR